MAVGHRQGQVVDYNEAYALVVQLTSVRVLFPLAPFLHLELDQMDVTTAFLNGDMDGDVYTEVPEACRSPGSNDLVCKLLKSLYGTEQAPRYWNQKINPFQVDEPGFEPCDADPCFYVSGGGDGFMIIAEYVDDLSIAGKSKNGYGLVESRIEQTL